MPAKRFAFNVRLAIPQAWDLIWSDNLKRQESEKDGYNPGQFYYITASDLENQVRTFADETARGEAWGTSGRAWGRYPTGVRLSVDVQRACRDWLFGRVRSGALQAHNFDRGHISGARFRPKGAPLTPAETKTFERLEKARTRDYKADPKPVHWSLNSGAGCVQIKKKGFSFSRPSRSTRTTTDLDKVTCPRCVKLRAEFEAIVAKRIQKREENRQKLRDEGKLVALALGTREQILACAKDIGIDGSETATDSLVATLIEKGYTDIRIGEHVIFPVDEKEDV